VDLEHDDIFASDKASNVRLPPEVDMTQAFEVATSLDMQHLDLGVSQMANLKHCEDMHILTHLNLNNNLLGDAGAELLFEALVRVHSTVVHVALSSNNIGDVGAEIIASNLGCLGRLTSLELCNNFIQENGSEAIANAVAGIQDHDEDHSMANALPMLSIDLTGNKTRFYGGMRWAEVITNHPKLQFLCLANNEIGMMNTDSFLGLVYGAVASPALSVLDLRNNFPPGPGQAAPGPPPEEVHQELLHELPPGEFDEIEVKQAVFIRRHRGGERKGRQPQQAHGSSRHNPAS